MEDSIRGEPQGYTFNANADMTSKYPDLQGFLVPLADPGLRPGSRHRQGDPRFCDRHYAETTLITRAAVLKV
jgi:hypothetical protein